MHTAFSREGPKKVYVQDKLSENAAEVNELLQKGKANVYVCGDAANMAREVNNILAQIIADQRGKTKTQGEEVIKSMRSMGIYQEDVWS
jgi:NADPH-ferrihemoprotein reductase